MICITCHSFTVERFSVMHLSSLHECYCLIKIKNACLCLIRFCFLTQLSLCRLTVHISSVGKEPVLLYLTDVLAFPVFSGPFDVQKSLKKFNSVATMLKNLVYISLVECQNLIDWLHHFLYVGKSICI